jgi:hypothetical protein
MARLLFARFLRRISSADPGVLFGFFGACVDGIEVEFREGDGSRANEGGGSDAELVGFVGFDGGGSGELSVGTTGSSGRL